MYALAFLTADPSTMEEQQRWFAGKSEVEHNGLSLASDTEAYAGRLHRARELTLRAVNSAVRADSKENAAIWMDAARVRALAAYKDFLTIWKDADPDIPILKEAKAEYAKMQ